MIALTWEIYFHPYFIYDCNGMTGFTVGFGGCLFVTRCAEPNLSALRSCLGYEEAAYLKWHVTGTVSFPAKFRSPPPGGASPISDQVYCGAYRGSGPVVKIVCWTTERFARRGRADRGHCKWDRSNLRDEIKRNLSVRPFRSIAGT